MDLRQLNALDAVAEHGTFSAAAAALHTVQSNVSTHVARLEKELGATLFDRAAGTLTAEGRAVVGRARRIQAELDALVADVTALSSEVRGSLRLGVLGTTGRWLVPKLLVRMNRKHPAVSITVVEASSATLEPQLVSGRLDLSIVTLPMPGLDLVATPLFEEDLVLIVPAASPFASRTEVAVADLDGLEMLLPAKGTVFRQTLDEAFATAGIHPVVRAELDGVRLLASLAFEGWAAGIVPASAIPSWLSGPWARLRVVGLPRRSIGLAQRARSLPSAPAKATAAVLAEVVWQDAVDLPGIHPVV